MLHKTTFKFLKALEEKVKHSSVQTLLFNMFINIKGEFKK
jgi:hypothetical protein